MNRQISFADAISEATCQAFERDPNVFLMGVGVDDPGGIFGTTRRVHQIYGAARVFDTPISEPTTTGAAIGAALCGMRPILVHARNDFLLLTLDQIANHAAKWSYMSGGRTQVPMVVRAIIGRGWGQAAQHSQSLQAVVAHFPGLHVLMPATPRDAKGLLLSALHETSPVVILEHRWSYGQVGEVPEEVFLEPIGKARIARRGHRCTVVACSYMVHEAMTAAERLASRGIEVEVVDLRTIRPWDTATVLESVKKTGRLVVADTGWGHFGVAAEISSTVSERAFAYLKAPVQRVALPDVPTPCAAALEQAYYPSADDIVRAVETSLLGEGRASEREERATVGNVKPFEGAF